jgi:hypothetical protein
MSLIKTLPIIRHFRYLYYSLFGNNYKQLGRDYFESQQIDSGFLDDVWQGRC